MTDKPVKIVCGHCGSENITRDALARWCVQSQAWEVSNPLDNADCEDCGASGGDVLKVAPIG